MAPDPSGRIIGRRKPIEADWDAVFEACRRHGVCLEINAQADRLDLPDIHCQRARDLGVVFVSDTDSHKTAELESMPMAIDVARRGWLERRDVINTRSAAQLRQWLKSRPHRLPWAA